AFTAAWEATFATTKGHPTKPALICAWVGGHTALGSEFAGVKLLGAAAFVDRTVPARVTAPEASVVARTTWAVSRKPLTALAGEATTASGLVPTSAPNVAAAKPVQATVTSVPADAPGTAAGLPLYVQLDVAGGTGVAAAGAAVSAGPALIATSSPP